jgi:hypothetical protein
MARSNSALWRWLEYQESTHPAFVEPVRDPADDPKPEGEMLALPLPEKRQPEHGRRAADAAAVPRSIRPARAAPRTATWHLPTVMLAVTLSTAASVYTAIALHQAPVVVTVPAAAAPAAPAAASTVVPVKRVELRGVASYNPFGTGPEHPEAVAFAADGDRSTSWSTETYSGVWKPGTGIVLATPSAVALSKIVVETSTPGFQAQIQVGSSPDGGFHADSSWKTVGRRTTFALDGKTGRYWLLWLRLPTHAGAARIVEVTAQR